MKHSSLGVRAVLSFVIIIILLIPIFMIQSLINDRQNYRREAVADIYKSWSGEQLVGGPVLTVLADKWIKDEKGIDILTHRTYNLLPDSLSIEAEMVPEKRYRGIYEVVVYQSRLKISADIYADRLKNIIQQDSPAKLTSAFISFNISDPKGINHSVNMAINNKSYEVIPGLKPGDVFINGFHSNIQPIDLAGNLHFDVALQLKGSETLQFLPLGKTTSVNIKSNWNNPGFIGEFLPDARKVEASGFNAVWNVNHFNRQFPQDWISTKNESPFPQYVFSSKFGVGLLTPVDEYQKNTRTSKYGLIIILLTFISFFLIEIFSKKVIHPIQYLLVGLALIIFYSLLLAISEYLLFQYSYLIASVLTISLISLYVSSIFNGRKYGLMISGLLVLFYGFMFVILQLQDLSLMLGSLALFIILASVMFITRRLNWYNLMAIKEEWRPTILEAKNSDSVDKENIP